MGTVRNGILGYDFTGEVARFCGELAANVRLLGHIDTRRVLFGVSVSRKEGRGGVFAACQPLRFRDGALRCRMGLREWEWPVVRMRGMEIMYYVNFYLPRFLNLSPADKLETIVHELYHISPRFDGDLRRLGEGRHAHHGPSNEFYARLIRPLVEQARELDLGRYAFLAKKHAELEQEYGRVIGQRVRRLRPRLTLQPGERPVAPLAG